MYKNENKKALMESLQSDILHPTDGDFTQKYTKLKKLGKGANGRVILARRLSDRLNVVVKTIKKRKTPRLEVNRRKLPVEALVLGKLRGMEGVVNIVEYYERKKKFHLVFEFDPEAEDLFDLVSRGCGSFTETTAKYLINQLVKIVLELRERGYVHGDIKEENLLLNRTNLSLKLIDFGAVEAASITDIPRVMKGTRAYTPPEVLRAKSYTDGDSLSVFSIGVIAFSLMYGNVPFEDDSALKAMTMEALGIKLKDKGISFHGMKFIYKCMHVNPDKRLKLNELPSQRWLRKDIPSEAVVSKEIQERQLTSIFSKVGEDERENNPPQSNPNKKCRRNEKRVTEEPPSKRPKRKSK